MSRQDNTPNGTLQETRAVPIIIMVEANNAAAIVSGYCAVLDGQPFGNEGPATSQKLSDHCPIFVDIEDRSRD